MTIKLTIVFLTAALFQIHASGISQTVTFSGKNVPLKKVFQAIKEQTGYVVFYNKQDLAESKPVSISLQNVPLEKFLELTLRDQPVKFRLDGETIVLSKKTETYYDGAFLEEPPYARVTGQIIATSRQPVSGASIRVKGTGQGTSTNESGWFSLQNVNDHSILQISSVGYEGVEIPLLRFRSGSDPNISGVKGNMSDDGELRLTITLKNSVDSLANIEITVSTGYQHIPKERSTGSFGTVDRKQLEQRPTFNILDRLEGFAGGLAFHRNSVDKEPKLIIRGRSTIYSNDQPLFVVDGFPIEGDLTNINPNDVEQITLLKDAAASSIWGVRAANGVVVITTKKGAFSQKPSVEVRSHIMVSRKPDLFYLPFMSTSDYVDLEKAWFDEGRYDSYFNLPPNHRQPLSPVIETLFAMKNGEISAQEGNAALDQLRSRDLRNEYNDVFFRNRIQQQNLLNIQGGSEHIRYFFSSGYDKSLSSEKGNEQDRITLRTDNTIRVLPKLDLTIAANIAWTRAKENGLGLIGFQGENSGSLGSALSTQFAFLPYQQLIDENGNAAVVPREYTTEYIEYLRGFGMYDWHYRPADELKYRDNNTRGQDSRIAVGLEYRLSKSLKVDLKYQFEGSYINNDDLRRTGSYYTRNILNTFTQFLPDSSGLINHVPKGDILIKEAERFSSHTFRAQLNFLKDIQNSKHIVAAIAGMEMRDVKREGAINSYYGYNDRTLLFIDLNKAASYPQFGRMFPLPFRFGGGIADELSHTQSRYASFYGNASYTFDRRYVMSASGRIDKSSLFGVRPKDRNVPLWSVGAAWNVDEEAFFQLNVVSDLKLRATYGFNGNVSPAQSAYPIAYTSNDPMTQLPTAGITTPANPLLQWEKVSQLNLGVDFGLFGNRLSGSFEWFSKSGVDLLGDHFLDPSSGFATIRANVASMKGKGFDLELNYRTGRTIRWDSKLVFSRATDKITKIALVAGDNFFGGTQNYMQADKQILPLLNRPVYAVYSYRWAGLDNQGNPQLYDENGEIGSYVTTLTSLPPDQLVYNGPAQPVLFGGWNNSISWKGFSVSATVTYKFGHKFRRSSINYFGLSSTGMFRSTGHSDYALRWMKAGDEAHTNVPSNPGYNSWDYNRDEAYRYSDILVESASHIRLKDVSLSYDLPDAFVRRGALKAVQLYLYIDNIGILWRANKHGIDPDYVPMAYSNYLPMPLSCTGGIKIEL